MPWGIDSYFRRCCQAWCRYRLGFCGQRIPSGGAEQIHRCVNSFTLLVVLLVGKAQLVERIASEPRCWPVLHGQGFLTALLVGRFPTPPNYDRARQGQGFSLDGNRLTIEPGEREAVEGLVVDTAQVLQEGDGGVFTKLVAVEGIGEPVDATNVTTLAASLFSSPPTVRGGLRKERGSCHRGTVGQGWG